MLKLFFLVLYTLFSIVTWTYYFNGSLLSVSALARASQNGGELDIVAASTFILHLCFLAGFVNIYKLHGRYEKIYVATVGVLITICAMSHVLSGTIFGSDNLAIYEPLLFTFLAVNAFAFTFGIVPGKYGASEI